MKTSTLFGLGVAALLTMAGAAGAQTIADYYDFTNFSDQMGVVQTQDGTLYGTLNSGGPYTATDDLELVGYGSVFKVATNGQFSILYNFGTVQDVNGNPLDGAYPNALTLGSDGNLYGTTESGGTNFTDGTVFQITTSGQLTTLYSFGTTAFTPAAGLVQGADGRFYGTTEWGGSTNGGAAGAVFAIDTNGNFSILNSFTSVVTNGQTNFPYGGYPATPLILGSDGNLYGTTPYGGIAGTVLNSNISGYGTIFQVIPSSGQLNVLYTFGSVMDTNGDPLDGAVPNGLVQGADGNLYGTTQYGGANDNTIGTGGITGSLGSGDGTVFLISPTQSNSFTTLFSFDENSSDTFYPIGSLITGPNGLFYGVTSAGGTNAGGGVFSFSTNSVSATNIVSLSAVSGSYGSDLQHSIFFQSYDIGAESIDNTPSPVPAIFTAGFDDNLYGTTTDGGTNGTGTVYQLGVPGFLPFYTVTVSASPTNGGSGTGAGVFEAGSTNTLTETPGSNFLFTNWTVNGGVVGISNTYTFVVGSNVNFFANFLPAATIALSASPTNAGSVGGAGTFFVGSTNTVTAAASNGYAFVDWTLNGVVVTNTTNYTFVLSSNVTLVANFLPLYSYTVSASPADGGTVSPDGTNESGGTVSVTATNDIGFAFENWTSNGVVVATTTNYSFSISTNVALVANFLPLYSYTVSASPLDGGTVSPDGTNEAGSTVSVTATNDAGFVFENWTSNGVVVASTTNYSFTIVTNVTLVANFAPLYSYTVSASPANGGTVSPGGASVSGGVISVTATNNSGFQFQNWTSNGVVVASTTNYTFTIVTNVTLVANFLPYYNYTVSASPSGDGTVSPGGTNLSGSVVSVTATNNSGFGLVNWTSNGVVVATSSNYSFTISTNVTLMANFAPLYFYTVSASPTNGGTASAGGTNVSGSTVSVLATNESGFAFENWTSNGVVVATTTNYSFSISTNVALVANFLPLYSYTVSASPLDGGTVSLDGTNESGSTVSVTATNDIGFAFENWTSNGVVVATTTNYSFTITTNLALVANFVPVYTVTVTASPTNGGTVGGGGVFLPGSTNTVTAIPNSGFAFFNWTSNGVAVASTTNYTFTISTNVTLVANFLPLYSYTVSASPTNGGTVSPGGTNQSGGTVSVSATNNSGYTFANWTSNGVVVASTTNYSFTIVTNVTLVANFLPSYTYTVSASPTNGGSASPGGTNESGTTVAVVATNNSGYAFANWTSNGVVVASTTNYSFTIVTNVTLVANFLPLYTYTVGVSPTNAGTASPGGTNQSGGTVTVTATNSPGYGFENWTSNGVVVTTSTNYSFAIATNVTLVANFLPLYTTTVSASPSNGGTVSPGGTNVSGSTVAVTATNNAGFAFENWTSNGVAVTTSSNYSFTIATNVTLVANFLPLYTTTVSASPTNGGAVSAGGTNVSGSTVTVSATNSPGYGFVNWTSNGVVVTTSTNYSFAIATNVTLVASFLPYYTTTVSASPSNGGTVSAGGTNLSGSTVAVVATNGAGFVFENWTSNGVAVATTTNYSFAIATNVTLVANFLPLYSITVSASPANGGTVGGGGTNVSGTTNTVTAAAAAGYAFSDWSSNSVTVSASNDYAFVLGTNVALVANFVLTPAQMEVLDGTNLITNNTAAPVEFGGVQSNQPGPIVTFTVTNLGGQALELTNVAVPAGFVLLTNGAGTITNFPWNIAGLSNGTFSVQLITTNIGTNAGEITITNSDTNQNPYVFAVSGTVSAPAPEIQVWNGSSLIVNNQTNAVSFGSVPLNQAGPILTFTVSNIGEETLAVSNLTVPAGYTLVSNAPGSIAAGSNGTFSVQLDTAVAGVMAGNITLADNDTNNNPFIFPVTGLVTTKIMALSGSLGFGVVPVDETAHGTLTISNSGDVNLTVSNITYPAGFSGAFSGVIAPGSAQSVTVTFAPLLPTNYAGVVTVNSDATGGAGSLAVTGFGANTNLVLTIITNGAGTVTPALAGKALKAGVKYTLTATAKSGNVFSNWTGSLSTNKNPLTFTMETSTIFEANFVPNPFLGLEGTYNGLFTPANGIVTEETSGMLKGLTVAGKGTYSGTLLLNGGSHALSGSFNLSGQATNVISRPASQGGPVVLEMTLNSNGPAPQISGTVSGVTNAAAWVAALTADYATNTLASAQYTLLLPPDTNNAPPAHSPGGESYATITNYAGTAKNPASANAKITGALADGTAFSQTVPVSYDGYVPVYANLYTGKGLLLGWINLDLTNTAGASLTWIHPATKTGLYTGGFTNQLLTNQIQLSRWSNAPAAIAQLTNLTLLETSAATNAETNIAISIDAAGKITGASVSGTLNPKTGVLTVTIGSGADKVSGYGAVLLDATNGGGYFLTKTNAQAIKLTP